MKVLYLSESIQYLPFRSHQSLLEMFYKGRMKYKLCQNTIKEKQFEILPEYFWALNVQDICILCMQKGQSSHSHANFINTKLLSNDTRRTFLITHAFPSESFGAACEIIKLWTNYAFQYGVDCTDEAFLAYINTTNDKISTCFFLPIQRKPNGWMNNTGRQYHELN